MSVSSTPSSIQSRTNELPVIRKTKKGLEDGKKKFNFKYELHPNKEKTDYIVMGRLRHDEGVFYEKKFSEFFTGKILWEENVKPTDLIDDKDIEYAPLVTIEKDRLNILLRIFRRHYEIPSSLPLAIAASEASFPRGVSFPPRQSTNLSLASTVSTSTTSSQSLSDVSVQPKDIDVSHFSRQRLGFIFLRNAWDLALAIEKDKTTALIKELVEKMAEKFLSPKAVVKSFIQEMSALLPVVDQETRGYLIKRLVGDINESYLDNKDAIDGLTHCLHALWSISYKASIDTQTKKFIIELQPSQLINIAELMISKIPKPSSATAENSDKLPPYFPYLQALISTLEIMDLVKVDKLEREKYHQPFYEALNRVKHHSNLKIAYLRAYGKQILVHLPDDETKAHAVVRHATHFAAGLINIGIIAAKIHFGKLDSSLVDNFIEALRQFREVLPSQEFEADWYDTLVSMRYLLLMRDHEQLKTFIFLIDQHDQGVVEAQKIFNKLHTHHPYFMMGLVQIIQQVIERYAAENPEIGDAAILWLSRIYKDNMNKAEGLFTISKTHWYAGLTRPITKKLSKESTDRDFSQQLKEEIYDSLIKYASTHSSKAIKTLAKTAIKVLHSQDLEKRNAPPPEIQSGSLERPDPLFKKALAKIAPWQKPVRQLCENLENDVQLQELPYYIEPEVQTPTQTIPLKDEIESFLDPLNPVQIMLIAGTTGTGKSLSVKKIAKELLEKEDPQYIPIFVSLPTLNDPRHAIQETLDKKGISSSLADLQEGKKIRILWIFDAVDETKTGVKAFLWDETNNLKMWINHGSKVIFTCRADYLHPKDIIAFRPEDKSDNFKRIDIFTFDTTRREKFIENFLKLDKREPYNISWSLDQYKAYIDSIGGLKEIVATPLYLKITALTLPEIVTKREKDGKPIETSIHRADLLDEFFCLTIARESFKLMKRSGGKPDIENEEYITYIKRVIEALDQYESKPQRGGPWIPREVAEEKYHDAFNEKNDALVFKRRCISLILQNDKYGFNLDDFYDYFHVIAHSENRQRKIKRLLDEDFYGLAHPLFKHGIISS